MIHRRKKLCAAVSLWLFAGIFVLASSVFANNATVSNVSLTGQDATNGSILVKFDASWENSWRTSSVPNNWDAVWLFVKYKVGSGEWKHASISTTAGDHKAPSGATITPSSDGKGAFVYRGADGSGTFSPGGVQLRWNYGADGVADNASVSLKVFAIEMVYVPTGSFTAGGVGTEAAKFIKTTINTADATQPGGYPTGETAPGNSNWPNGFNAFYCMKYEVTQEQYVDFLNTLTYTQQAARTEVSPDKAAGTKAMTTGSTYRSGIEVQTPGSATTAAAVYGCDLTDDGTYNASDDGQGVACNWLSWADGAAYTDWAALRPMTELEYEKACRGTLDAVANEYAWGSTAISKATGITNGGTGNETAGNSGANCVFYDANMQGPMRAGSFATAVSGRVEAGATYYGVMEMSGNLWERCVTVGNSDGRSFTGTHGDGVLDSTGNADATGWPGSGASGAGFRGGAWSHDAAYARVADRGSAAFTPSGRFRYHGFRAVRLDPSLATTPGTGTTPTPTATVTPALTPSPTPALTPTPTPVQKPTPTPTPASTPTPTPAASPTPIVYKVYLPMIKK